MSEASDNLALYRATHDESLASPHSFWLTEADRVDWITSPTTALDESRPPFYRWFPDGVLNTCFNALDRHVEAGFGERKALIYDSPITGATATLSYSELLNRVARFAGVLDGLGVRKGDRVIIYMPMIPEAVVAMLACARIGAIHSVVFGGFAPQELAARIDDSRPKVVLTASCGIEPNRVVPYKPMLDQALELAVHHPDHCIVKQRRQLQAELTPGRDLDWNGCERDAQPASCVPILATDPLYILYTSGTTGTPKGIVRDNGGHAVAMAWSMANVYDIHGGDVWWAASDVGWVVGHSYITYGPLIAGATTVLYEGKPVGTPDAGAFWRVVAEHGVQGLFTAPTAIRAIKKEDPQGALAGQYDLSTLRNLFLAGERLDPDTYAWAGRTLNVPVIDNWWQTETGWPIASNLRGLAPLPTKPGSPSHPVPGYSVKILDAQGRSVDAGTEGSICIKLPLPPGALSTLWEDDDRFAKSYLSSVPGYYLSGDGGYIDQDGYLFVMGRTDDVINVAGHRLSTGAIESVISSHPAVAECAVVGVTDSLKGQVPRAFAALRADATVEPDALEKELVLLVREQIGPVAALRSVTVVPALPKTRSGKLLRRTMREVADGEDPAVPPTIDDEQVLTEFRTRVVSDPA